MTCHCSLFSVSMDIKVNIIYIMGQLYKGKLSEIVAAMPTGSSD